MAQQAVGALAVFRAPGQANAAGDQGGVALEVEGQLQGLQQRLDALDAPAIRPFENKGKFIAAQPAQAILRFDDLHEARRGLLQQQVAHGMAEAVIDLLEAVDIQHQHRQALALVDFIEQLLMKAQAVGQAGDRIEMRQALQLRLGQLEFTVTQVDQVVAAVELGDEHAEQAGAGQGKQEQG
ncbi:hypothetical protein D9M71_656540 [compost metagenome]